MTTDSKLHVVKPKRSYSGTIFHCGSTEKEDLLTWTSAVASFLKEMVASVPNSIELSGQAKDGLFCLLEGISNTIDETL